MIELKLGDIISYTNRLGEEVSGSLVGLVAAPTNSRCPDLLVCLDPPYNKEETFMFERRLMETVWKNYKWELRSTVLNENMRLTWVPLNHIIAGTLIGELLIMKKEIYG